MSVGNLCSFVSLLQYKTLHCFMVLTSYKLSVRKTGQCSMYFNSLYCVHTHSTHRTIHRLAVFSRMPRNIWWKINRSIKKNVIYKYPPIFLTLPAFYPLVCYIGWIEACARQFSPGKQRRLFALASFSILLLWSLSTKPGIVVYLILRKKTYFCVFVLIGYSDVKTWLTAI